MKLMHSIPCAMQYNNLCRGALNDFIVCLCDNHESHPTGIEPATFHITCRQTAELHKILLNVNVWATACWMIGQLESNIACHLSLRKTGCPFGQSFDKPSNEVKIVAPTL